MAEVHKPNKSQKDDSDTLLEDDIGQEASQ